MTSETERKPRPRPISPDPTLADFMQPGDLAIEDSPMPELPEGMPLEEQVQAVLQTIRDPEIPVDIWELGLIYRLDISDDGKAEIDMTLTAAACPVAGSMPGVVKEKVERLPGIKECTVTLVWEPAWNRDMMSEAAQLELGLY